MNLHDSWPFCSVVGPQGTNAVKRTAQGMHAGTPESSLAPGLLTLAPALAHAASHVWECGRRIAEPRTIDCMYPDPFHSEAEPDVSKADVLIQELELQAALLTAVATGGPRIDDVKSRRRASTRSSTSPRG